MEAEVAAVFLNLVQGADVDAKQIIATSLAFS